MEIWKQIKGYEGLYEVSNLGRVHGIRFNVIRKYCIDKHGYPRLAICKNGNKKTLYIHQLVAIAFHDNPENKSDVNHKNGIKTDNRAENLEWCTRSENLLHAFRTGLKKPSHHLPSNTILSFEKAEQMRALKKSGVRAVELCSLFGVKEATVYTVLGNKKWTIKSINQ